MKALTLVTADGPESVSIQEHATPEPGPGQVRVAVRAAALNHRELWITRGQYPGMTLPCTLGADGAGVIDAVGEGVDAARIGEEVLLYPGMNWGADPALPATRFALLGMPGPGTIAEFICLDARDALRKPAHLSFAEAAATPLAGVTAWRGLRTKGELKAGEKLLITGVGGGVGAFACMLGVALGADVYVTSGNEQSLKRAAESGAKAGFNYKDAEWRKALASAAKGVDVVFDGAPAASFANYVRALRTGARVVLYGSTGGPSFNVSAPDIFLRNLRLIGTNVGTRDELEALAAFMAEHKLKPPIDRTFAFADAKEALAYLDGAHGYGKVVVTF